MLNIQKGNMYGFVTHTWNTVKGECLHNCKYCYMKRFKQNPIRFDEKELKTNLGENNFIFVGSSCDMFSENIPDEWINETIKHCEKYNNQYLFQSKNVNSMLKWVFPKNTILATTIETDNNELILKYSNAPEIYKNRINIKDIVFQKRMITIEPIMKFHSAKSFFELIKYINPFQVNIGADSKNSNLPEPTKDEVNELISELKKTNIKLFLKDNLKRLTATSHNNGYEAR